MCFFVINGSGLDEKLTSVSPWSMAMLPVLRRGLMSAAGSLLAGINPVPPRGKSLTLEEYKVRQGIE